MPSALTLCKVFERNQKINVGSVSKMIDLVSNYSNIAFERLLRSMYATMTKKLSDVDSHLAQSRNG